jgi:hypothetical protein
VQASQAFNRASNEYDAQLQTTLSQARNGCLHAAAPQGRYIEFTLQVDSTFRQLHDVVPFAQLAGRLAALPGKPASLVALAKDYAKEAAVLRPLSSRSPRNSSARLNRICDLYLQWGRHGWNIRWLNDLSVREYAAAGVRWGAAHLIARAAIRLQPALRRDGATYKQALSLTAPTLAFG